MSQLATKKRKAQLIIISAALGTGITSAAPTPTIEIPKQLTLIAADITMCFAIYQVFFGDEINLVEGNFISLMEEAFDVTVLAGLMSSLALHSIRGIQDEMLDWAGPYGWVISGGLTGSKTLVVGTIWLKFCSERYKQMVAKGAF